MLGHFGNIVSIIIKLQLQLIGTNTVPQTWVYAYVNLTYLEGLYLHMSLAC